MIKDIFKPKTIDEILSSSISINELFFKVCYNGNYKFAKLLINKAG